MARVKTTLVVEADGNKTSFSNTKTYTEETITKFYVGRDDTFQDLIQFSPEDIAPTKVQTQQQHQRHFAYIIVAQQDWKYKYKTPNGHMGHQTQYQMKEYLIQCF